MDILTKARLLQTTFLSGLLMSMGGVAYAQTNDEEPVAVPEAVEETTDEDDDRDEIVVTGSRLKKDTFSSVAPLQVINTDTAAEQGLLNPVEILQTSSVAAVRRLTQRFKGLFWITVPVQRPLTCADWAHRGHWS